MLKPNRGLNKPSAGDGKKSKGRRTAVLVLLLAACSAAVLTACSSQLKTALKNSILGGESTPTVQAAVDYKEDASGAGTSSESASSAPSSAQPPASSAAQPEHVAYEDAAKPLWISVSLDDQTVSVLDAKNRVVYQYACSTGQPGDDTPTGTFSVSDKGKSFYNPDVEEGAYYWTRFKGTFLFHSLPFDSKEKMIPEEAEKLGTKASHGCVRLAVENAKWIYDNIPKGTKVVIK